MEWLCVSFNRLWPPIEFWGQNDPQTPFWGQIDPQTPILGGKTSWGVPPKNVKNERILNGPKVVTGWNRNGLHQWR